MMPLVLPKLGYIQIIVSEVVDPAHFWAQRVDTAASMQLQTMMDAINADSDGLVPLLHSPQDLVGQLCVAPYSENGQYYRAKVQSIAPTTGLVMVREGGEGKGGGGAPPSYVICKADGLLAGSVAGLLPDDQYVWCPSCCSILHCVYVHACSISAGPFC